MSDPMEGLKGLQVALNAKTVQLTPCTLYSQTQVLLDHPNGATRFTYAQIENKQVQAIALLVLVDPVDGVPCFQIGYAVIDSLRGQGKAKQIAKQAIDEITHGLGKTLMREFYVEAIVAPDNVASNKIASQLITDSPVTIQDQISGCTAFQYLRKIQCSV